jgi:hypothetical protein
MKILLIYSPSLLVLQEVKLITDGLRPKKQYYALKKFQNLYVHIAVSYAYIINIWLLNMENDMMDN